jgi:hypothetical protein
MRKHRRRNWLVRGFVLGLAVLVVGVPVAQARVDGSSGWSGPRHGEKFAQGVPDAPSPSAQEVLRSNLPEMSQPRVARGTPPAPAQIGSRSDGFNRDAGIGAGTAFAVMLLAAGGMLGSRRIRRHRAIA